MRLLKADPKRERLGAILFQEFSGLPGDQRPFHAGIVTFKREGIGVQPDMGWIFEGLPAWLDARTGGQGGVRTPLPEFLHGVFAIGVIEAVQARPRGRVEVHLADDSGGVPGCLALFGEGGLLFRKRRSQNRDSRGRRHQTGKKGLSRGSTDRRVAEVAAEVGSFAGQLVQTWRFRLPVAGRAEHVASMIVRQDKEEIGPARRLRHTQRGSQSGNDGTTGGVRPADRHFHIIRAGFRGLYNTDSIPARFLPEPL